MDVVIQFSTRGLHCKRISTWDVVFSADSMMIKPRGENNTTTGPDIIIKNHKSSTAANVCYSITLPRENPGSACSNQ